MTQNMKFDTKEELAKFSEMASQCDFPVYLSTPYGQVDARSLLGLFLCLGKETTVVAGDHTDVNDFVEFLEKYKKAVG